MRTPSTRQQRAPRDRNVPARTRRRGGRRAALRRRLRALSPRDKILCWHLYQAALAGRDIYYDQRYAHNLEMRRVLEAVRHAPAGVDAARRLDAICALHEAVLDQHRAVQQPDRAKVRAGLHAGGVCGRRARGRSHGREPAARGRRIRRRPAGAAAPAVLRSRVRVGRHEQDAGRRAATSSRRAPTTSTSASRWPTWKGSTERYPLNSRLVKTDDGLVEEVYRVGGRYCDRDRANRGAPRGGDPVRDRANGARARRARAVLSHRRDRAIGARTTSRGWPTPTSHVDTINELHRGLHGRPRREGRVGIACLLRPSRRRPRPSRRSPRHAQWFEDRMPWDPQ